MASNSTKDTPAAPQTNAVSHGIFGKTTFRWKIMDFLKQVEFAQTAKKTRLKSDVFQVTAQGGKPGSTLVRNFSLFFQWEMLKMKVSMT